MSQLITMEAFAKNIELPISRAMRIVRKNKFLRVKVDGVRRPFVDYSKWDAKKLMQ